MKKTSPTGLLNCSAVEDQCLCPSSMTYETFRLMAEPLHLFFIKKWLRRLSFVNGMGFYDNVAVLKNGDIWKAVQPGKSFT